MDKTQSFKDYLASSAPDIPGWEFALFLTLTFVFSYLLGRLYAKYGNSLSNKVMFASNFELIAMTTMVIITIVKSSLALSLGLVGALSIVRFRAAIKEPEELAYIFFTIAIGLGFGAGQWQVTIIGFLFVALVIWLKSFLRSPKTSKNLNFTILADKSTQVSLNNIVETVTPHCKGVELKRLDENKDFLEASFLVEFENFSKLSQARDALLQLNENLQINFLDQKGII